MIGIEVRKGRNRAIVSVNKRWNDAGKIQFEGDDPLVKELRASVPLLRGAFGHILGRYAEPADVWHALTMQGPFYGWELTVVEGAIGEKLTYPEERNSVT